MEIEYNDLSKYSYLEKIDMRDKKDFNKGHLYQAKNISFTALILNPEKYLTKNKAYLLICERGVKSKKTSDILNNMGYQTYSLKNGIRSFLN